MANRTPDALSYWDAGQTSPRQRPRRHLACTGMWQILRPSLGSVAMRQINRASDPRVARRLVGILAAKLCCKQIGRTIQRRQAPIWRHLKTALAPHHWAPPPAGSNKSGPSAASIAMGLTIGWAPQISGRDGAHPQAAAAAKPTMKVPRQTAGTSSSKHLERSMV